MQEPLGADSSVHVLGAAAQTSEPTQRAPALLKDARVSQRRGQRNLKLQLPLQATVWRGPTKGNRAIKDQPSKETWLLLSVDPGTPYRINALITF